MADDETTSNTSNQKSQELSPEQVRQVADRVYQLLLQEVRIDNERRRPQGNRWRFARGGR